MRQLQPVLWTRGLVLSPQHLQAQDRFFEDALSFQLAAVSPWLWGFKSLAFDLDALPKGELVVTEATGAFPDGALFSSPDADGRIPPRAIQPLWHADQPTLTAYLALPDTRSDGRNVAMMGEEASTRFVAEVIRRKDDNTGLAERELQVAQKNIKLLIEGESLEGYSVLPAIRLLRTPSGGIAEDPSFLPPMVSTAGSARLQALAERMAELLASRGSSLAALRRQRSGALAHFSVSDVANFWLLYTVNGNQPTFRHLADRRGGHPSELFENMLTLAGSLSTFATSFSPRDLPSYQHGDAGPGFDLLEKTIRELLEKAIPEHCLAITLKRVDDNTQAASLDDERLLRPVAVYLAVRSDLTPADTAHRIPTHLKISSMDAVPGLIRQALPGARLTHAPSPPSAVPMRLDSQYFEIDRSGAEWQSIVRARNLAAYAPSELGRLTLELVVLLPERV